MSRISHALPSNQGLRRFPAQIADGRLSVGNPAERDRCSDRCAAQCPGIDLNDRIAGQHRTDKGHDKVRELSRAVTWIAALPNVQIQLRHGDTQQNRQNQPEQALEYGSHVRPLQARRRAPSPR